MVSTLLKPGQDIIDSLTPERADALHNAVGLSGEVGELCECIFLGLADTDISRPNFIEEIGDAEFYIEGLCQNYAIPSLAKPYPTGVFGDVVSDRSDLLIVLVKLGAHAGRVLDVIKKEVVYNRKLRS